MRPRAHSVTDLEKRRYFLSLATSVKSALRIHQGPGELWKRGSHRRREWGHVTEHCLVVAARTRTLSQMLMFDPPLLHNIVLAAALHDAFKKHEILARSATADVAKLQAIREVEDLETVVMRDAGFNEEVIRLAHSAGGGNAEVLFETKRILDDSNSNDAEIAFLIIHYVDGYTYNAEWVLPSKTLEDGRAVNEVDRRMEKNIVNYGEEEHARLKVHENHPFFRGKTASRVDGELCHLIEEKLVRLIQARTGETIKPICLPEVIDQKIRQQISQMEA